MQRVHVCQTLWSEVHPFWSYSKAANSNCLTFKMNVIDYVLKEVRQINAPCWRANVEGQENTCSKFRILEQFQKEWNSDSLTSRMKVNDVDGLTEKWFCFPLSVCKNLQKRSFYPIRPAVSPEWLFVTDARESVRPVILHLDMHRSTPLEQCILCSPSSRTNVWLAIDLVEGRNRLERKSSDFTTIRSKLWNATPGLLTLPRYVVTYETLHQAFRLYHDT